MGTRKALSGGRRERDRVEGGRWRGRGAVRREDRQRQQSGLGGRLEVRKGGGRAALTSKADRSARCVILIAAEAALNRRSWQHTRNGQWK